MKKSLLSMFAVAAGLLLATSCSNEFEEVKTEGEAVVTFTAELPHSVVNRAPSKAATASSFGDGTTATHLSYAVYEVNGDNWSLIEKLSSNTTLTNLKTTISLNLSNGTTYAVAFWADAEGSIYDFDKDNFTITANYADGVVSSNENLDAFYAVKTLTVNGASQQVVELHRPFAQLNIGTSDLQASADANHEVKQAGIKVKTYSTLNLKSGDVEGEAAEVTFALADLPSATFPVDGYSYLAMNYLLVSADKTADNVISISYDEASGIESRTFENVPLQRNYRTNIYGKLLTNTTDFNVEVKPDFDGTEDVKTWDGVTVTEPQRDANDNYLVSNAAEWVWLAQQNGRYYKSVGNKVYITKDIYFGGYNVPSLDPGNNDVGISLDLIDGQGHKFSNILLGNNDGTNASLIRLRGTTIKNLTIENVTVKSTGNDEDNRASVICASLQGGILTIDNVHLINANVSGSQSVAGFVGLVASGTTVNISNSTIKNSTISNRSAENESGFVAGFIGRVQGTATVTNCSAENTTVDAFYAVDKDHIGSPRRDAESIQPIAVKEYVSRVSGASLTITNTPETGVTVRKNAVINATVSSQAELTEALAAGKICISLAVGEYSLTALTLTNDVTLIGADKATTIVKLEQPTSYTGSLDDCLDARGHKVSLNNVTYKQTGSVWADLTHVGEGLNGVIFAGELVMNNCSCDGTVAALADRITLKGCNVNNQLKSSTKGYPIVFFGNDNCTIVMEDCEINGKTKGLMLYAYNNAYTYDLTVTNCKFISTMEDDKAAIELHTEYGIKGNLTINNTSWSGFPTTDIYNGGLWHEIVNASIADNPYGVEGTQTKRFKVTVDGVVKQEQVL